MFEFGRLRSFVWPIHRHELKKFLPMLFIFFLIAFNYNLLRAAKDAMIVTAPSSGAEALPFIKVWAVLPAAILITFLFTRLNNRFTREKVFYIMMSLFLGFFLIFTFFLYPWRANLHPHGIADNLETILPSGFHGMIAIFRNWTLTIYYVMSELWSTIILSVSFWGFANEITSVKEAKRFYSIFALGANIAGYLSGQAAVYLSKTVYNPNIPFGQNGWEQSILFSNLTIIIVGMGIICLFRHLHRKILKDPAYAIKEDLSQPKIKMSMRKNFAYLAKSKYLICIAAIVLTYNLSLNLVEVAWKNQMKELYPNPSDYYTYMGQVMKAMAIIATITALFISGNVIRKTSWTFSAAIPPAIMLITGIFFFSFMLLPDTSLAPFIALLGATPVAISVFFGSLQNCLSRASKYTLFDATKEMAFIPLNKESKLKGKAAIDGVGSRIGKSGGSIIHQGLLMAFATISASLPYIAFIFFLVIGVWLFAVISLGKQFNILTKRRETLEIPERPVVVKDSTNQEALG